MFISSNLEISRRMSVSQGDKQVHIVDVRENDSDKFHSNSSCLLCGSSEDCSYEMETGNRVKWTLHFCQLFRIDECPLVPKTTKAEMWTTMQSALYCSDCMDSLERISHLLQTIEDINAQLRVIQLQCEAKLKASKQKLHDLHEVNRRRALWTCMRLCGYGGGWNDGTEIDLPSRSTSLAKSKDVWDNNNNVEDLTEFGRNRNSPGSHFLLVDTDTDADSTFESDPLLKYETVDDSGSSFSPMSNLPSNVLQEQRDAAIKVESPKAVSQSLDDEEQEEVDKCERRLTLKRHLEASCSLENENELSSKKSKILEPKKRNQNQKPLFVFYLKNSGTRDVRRTWGKQGSEVEGSLKLKCPSSSSRSLCKAPKFVLVRGRQSHVRTRCSVSENAKEKKREKTMSRRKSSSSGLGNQTAGGKRRKQCEGRLECPFAPECKRKFHIMSRRDEHVVLVHEGKKFTCEICGKSYGQQQLLHEHGNTHKGLTPFKCPDCPKEFAMSLHLRMHKLNAHKYRPVKCKSCSKSFSSDANYQKHLQSATHRRKNMPKPKVKVSLNLNLKAKVRTPRPYLPRTRAGPHKCPFPTCDRAYTAKGSFKKHLRTHDEATRASRTCTLCERTYESVSSLERHQALLHMGEGKFRCEREHCPFISMQRFALEKHMMTVHSEERPLSCDICGHTFKLPCYLHRHKESYHPTTKDYMCSTCGKCFSNKRYLKDHERIHSEVKSFHCSECGRGFAQRPSLGRHLRNVHKIPTTFPAHKVKVHN